MSSLTRIITSFANHRRRRLATLQLADLGDHQLRDIGLTRYDIRAAKRFL